MKYLEGILGLILLFFCMSGYFLFLLRKFKIKIEFIPIIVCSTIGIAMFTAGLVNVLKAMSCLIIVLGIGLLLLEIKRKRISKNELKSFSVIFFLVLSVVVLVYSRNVKFAGWDNFSHWALVVKTMLQTNRFPNFMDGIIIFQSYPTGSASFIYFVCKLVGESEGVMYFAQMLLMISGILCLGAFVDKKHILHFMSAAIGLFLLTCNTYVDGLMVDSLLAILGFSGIAVLYYYRKDLVKGIICSLPILCLLMETKNSGIFFVAICWLVAVVLGFKYDKSKNVLCAVAGMIILPVSYMYLWKKHVAMVFVDGASSLHSMSIQNYSNVFNGKTSQNIMDILVLYVRKVFSITENSIWVLGILIILLYLYFRRIDNKVAIERMKWFIGLSVIIYGGWHLSLMATYVFSMPLGEALELASYERYHITIIQFMIGIWGIFLLETIENGGMKLTKKKEWFGIMGVSMIVLVLAICSFSTMMDRTGETYKRREKLVTIIENNQIPKSSSYILYTNEADNGYMIFVGKYDLNTVSIMLANKDTVQDISDWDNYEYFLMLDQNKDVEKYVSDTADICVVTQK